MPHFGITPEGWKIGDLLKGSIPHLSIDWYARGGIFTGASVIGVGDCSSGDLCGSKHPGLSDHLLKKEYEG